MVDSNPICSIKLVLSCETAKYQWFIPDTFQATYTIQFSPLQIDLILKGK